PDPRGYDARPHEDHLPAGEHRGQGARHPPPARRGPRRTRPDRARRAPPPRRTRRRRAHAGARPSPRAPPPPAPRAPRRARLARDAAGAWMVEDLGSRNGVVVDGVRRDRAELRDGSVIRVGKSLLLFSEQETCGLALIRDEAAPLFGPSLAMGGVRGEIER